MFSRFFQNPKITKCVDKLTKTGSPHQRSRYINLCKVLNNILITDDIKLINEDFTFLLNMWFNDRSVIFNIHKHLRSIGICILDDIVITSNASGSGYTLYNRIKYVGQTTTSYFDYDSLDFNEYYLNQIETCPNDIMAIPIELYRHGDNTSHENMLIVKRLHNSHVKFIVEHFEPFGDALIPEYNFFTEIQQLVYQILSFGVDSQDEIQIINVSNNCSIQLKLQRTTYADSCAIISLWYAIRRLLNPEEDPYQTYKEIEDFVKKNSTNTTMRNIVASFISLIDINENGIINNEMQLNKTRLDDISKTTKMYKNVKQSNTVGGKKRKVKKTRKQNRNLSNKTYRQNKLFNIK